MEALARDRVPWYPRPGETIDRYEVLFELARGGMAAVFVVRREGPGGFSRLLAMKVLLPHLQPEKRFCDMFLDEARIASAVHSRHVVQVLDVGESHGAPFLVMELLRGASLRHVLSSTKASRIEVDAGWHARVLADVATGLNAAHETRASDGRRLDVVHRDVSPENVHVGDDGLVRVVDFGIAAARDRLVHSETGELRGKLAYMSPEQVAGRAVDRRADVWALGVMGWEMLTGSQPFKRASGAETLWSVLHFELPPLSQLAPTAPPEMRAIIERCLSRDVEHRPSTALEVADALDAVARTLGFTDDSAVAHPVLDVLESQRGALETRIARALVEDDRPVRFDAQDAAREQVEDETGSTRPTTPERRAPATDEARPTSRAGGRAEHPREVAEVVLPTRGAADAADVVRPTRWWRRAIASAFLIGLVGAAVATKRFEPESKPWVDPGERIAVVPLETRSGAEPWSGAAVAAMVAERVAERHGGQSSLVESPASLLGLPPTPTDELRAPPYETSEARRMALETSQGLARIDGSILSVAGRTIVELQAFDRDGEHRTSVRAEGPSLMSTARDAVDELFAALPLNEPLDRRLVHVLAVPDAAGLTQWNDSQAGTTRSGALAPTELCRAAEAPLTTFAHAECYLAGIVTSPPRISLDRTDAARLAWTSRYRMMLGHRDDWSAIAGELERAAGAATNPLERAELAASASELWLGAGNAEAAHAAALRAIAAEPRHQHGWAALVHTVVDTPSELAAFDAYVAWHPHRASGWAWLAGSRHREASALGALELARRAHVLAPHDTRYAYEFATALVSSGNSEGARAVAATLGSVGTAEASAARECVLAAIDSSLTRFDAAERRLRAWVLADVELGRPTFEIASVEHAITLAHMLERNELLGDAIADRLLRGETTVWPIGIAAAVALCLEAREGRRVECLRAVRSSAEARGATWGTADRAALLAGAEAFALDDLSLASRHWRALVRDADRTLGVLREPMVRAFEHTGDTALVERVDALLGARARLYGGATLSDVRSARRAFERGAVDEATTAANRVAQAWQFADVAPPILTRVPRGSDLGP